MGRSLLRVLLLVVVVATTAMATLWITGDDPGDALTGVTNDTGAANTDSESVIPSGDVTLASSLQPFDDCSGLLDYFVGHALEEVGPYGLGGVGFAMAEAGTAAADATAGGAEAATSTAPAAQDRGAEVSGTNVQEVGVDEADIVKADERVLVTATVGEGRLRLVDLGGDTPRVAGSVPLPESYQQDVFLEGDRVLVLSGTTSVGPGPVPLDAATDVRSMPVHLPTSTLTLVDIADLDAPRVVETLDLDGAHVSARMVDGVARIVLRSEPVGLDFVWPEGGGLRAEREATERNRAVIRNSTIDNWLPAYVRSDGDGNVLDEGRMLACEHVHAPDVYAGLGLTTVLSVDMGGAFVPRGASAVVSGGDMVYATPTSLYVAMQSWTRLDGTTPGGMFGPDTSHTSIHRFSIEDPERAVYTGSGGVEGRLLNQWAMSEHDGHLRVATTTDGRQTSQSSVVVLDTAGSELDEVGRVDGLGVTEQIYAVRYMGDLGYVVTFRQTDPLYVVDLSDPEEPAVLGELKIPGFSSYLHPVGDGRLLGVGQDADAEGRTTGLQVSLFDVTNPGAPVRLSTVDLGPGWSPVEHDHRAFLYWEPAALAVLPVERHEVMPVDDTVAPGEPGPDEPMPPQVEPFLGAAAVRVDGDELRTVAMLEHDAPRDLYDPIMRSQVVNGQLLTVSGLGIGYGPVTDLADRAFLPLD